MFRIFHYKPITVFKVLLFQLRYHKVLTYCVKPIIIKDREREREGEKRERGGKRERERKRIVTSDCLFYSITCFYYKSKHFPRQYFFFYYVSLTILHYFSNNAVSKIKFRK